MRGCIYKRGKNSWTVVVDLPRDPVTNKRRQKSITVKGTKKDAERELARLINEIETGLYVEPSCKPLHPTAIQKAFARLVKIAGATPIRFHDLRHTHATLLLEKGVHPKIVSERLGHSSIQMTLTDTATCCRTRREKRSRPLKTWGFKAC